MENQNRGLGLQGDWHGKANWYGGRVQQVARIVANPHSETFDLRLEKMQMTRSHRFARFLGSRRVLQVKLSGDRWRVAVERDFLAQKFVLCGRIFVPFSTKDEKAYMMEINDDYERAPLDSQGDQHRRSLGEFVRWHNAMATNAHQV